MSEFYGYGACIVSEGQETVIETGDSSDTIDLEPQHQDVRAAKPSASYVIGMWFFLMGSCVWTVDCLREDVVDYLELVAAVCFDLGCMLFLLEAHWV